MTINSRRPRTAVVPVAGRGSRMAPLTNTVPKELLPFGRTTVLEHIVEELFEAELERIILVSSEAKPLIDTFADDFRERRTNPSRRLDVVRQGSVRGNGGAILTAAQLINDESFVVVWGDEVFVGPSRTRQLLEASITFNAPVISLVKIGDEDVSKCGIVVASDPQDNGSRTRRVREILEKPDPISVSSRLASVGGFVINQEIVDTLRRTSPSSDGEIYLSTALDATARSSRLEGVELEAQWYETGSFDGYYRAVAALAKGRNRIIAQTGGTVTDTH